MRRWLQLFAFLCGLLAIVPAKAAGVERPDFGGRQMIVYVPANLPPSGARALVIVLHGGLGNADRIYTGGAEKGLNLDALADKDGFIVAYLNGTAVTRRMGAQFKGWNAGGGCCGAPAADKVDDVGYIAGAVGFLSGRYGIDRRHVFAIGHSNGAMMAQRIACETGVFAAIVAVSGPLNLDVASCPKGQGRRVLAIHGADDANVPIQGGVGRNGLSKVAFRSEASSGRAWAASGAAYTLDVVAGADHFLDHLDAALARAEGVGIGPKAVAFFGLETPRR